MTMKLVVNNDKRKKRKGVVRTILPPIAGVIIGAVVFGSTHNGSAPRAPNLAASTPLAAPMTPLAASDQARPLSEEESLKRRALELSDLVDKRAECQKYAQLFLDLGQAGNRNAAGFAGALAGGRAMAQEARCMTPQELVYSGQQTFDRAHQVAKIIEAPLDGYLKNYVFGPMAKNATDTRIQASRSSERIINTPSCEIYRKRILALGEQFSTVSGAFFTAIINVTDSAKSVGCLVQ